MFTDHTALQCPIVHQSMGILYRSMKKIDTQCCTSLSDCFLQRAQHIYSDKQVLDTGEKEKITLEIFA